MGKNYRNYSKSNQVKEQDKMDFVDPEKIENDTFIDPEKEDKDGVVVDCEKLYVREEPSKVSKPLAIINKSDSVRVHNGSSTPTFYKVTTEDGVEGYCMRAYVAIDA